MGLISTAINAVKGTLADQWKEYFYCEAMESDILVEKGRSVHQNVLLIKMEQIILLQTDL